MDNPFNPGGSDYDFSSAIRGLLSQKTPLNLGADTDLAKALESGDEISEATKKAIAAGMQSAGSAIGSVASEASKNAQARTEMELKSLANLGESRRKAQSGAASATQNALAHLMASFRAASQ
jgi:hypothetical protein